MRMTFLVEIPMTDGTWRVIAKFYDDYEADQYCNLILGARVRTTLS